MLEASKLILKICPPLLLARFKCWLVELLMFLNLLW